MTYFDNLSKASDGVKVITCLRNRQTLVTQLKWLPVSTNSQTSVMELKLLPILKTRQRSVIKLLPTLTNHQISVMA